MKMPTLFVGHGSPMNAIEDNRWSRGFTRLGQALPTPRAILAVSAHWTAPGLRLTGNAQPKTIHDFSGFPPELYETQYPAPGSPDLAQRISAALHNAVATDEWGLDHGTWSVLKWMYPTADVPVVQLSLNDQLTPMEHLSVARQLEHLRDDKVLVIGSGNIVHNLADAFQRMRSGNLDSPDWATRFDHETVRVLREGTRQELTDLVDTVDGQIAHPTQEHWLPLLYAAGAADVRQSVSFPIEGFDWGSLSMRAIIFE